MGAYVNSAQFSFSTSGSGSSNFSVNKTFAYSGSAGDFLILSQTNNASNVFMHITGIVDDGGNTWTSLSVWGSGNDAPDAWYTQGISPTTQITVTFTVLGVAFGTPFTINGNAVVGEYSGFSYVSTGTTFSNTQQCSVPGSPSVGIFLESNNTAANTFAGPYTGGTVRQTVYTDGAAQPGHSPYYAGISLVDNLAGTISQTLTNPQAPTNSLFFGGAVVGPAGSSCNLAVSPSSLSFSALAGGSNPASQNVTISNIGGGGSVTYSFTASQSWITPSSGSGSTPEVVAIGVNIAGLTAGVYTGSVTFTSSCGSSPVTVNLQLTISNGLVELIGNFEDLQSVAISNGYLEVSLNQSTSAGGQQIPTSVQKVQLDNNGYIVGPLLVTPTDLMVGGVPSPPVYRVYVYDAAGTKAWKSAHKMTVLSTNGATQDINNCLDLTSD